MKKVLIILIVVCFIASCAKTPNTAENTVNNSSANSPVNENNEKKDQTDSNKIDSNKQDNSNKQNTQTQNSPVLGTYTGGFEATAYNENKDYVYENRITISLDSIDGDTIAGHSIVAGNNRPFKGSIKQDGKSFKVDASEPGDDKYDGSFSFTVNPESKTVSGIWKANDKKVDVTERKYTLAKKQFKYDPSLRLPEDVQWTALYDKNPKFPDKEELLTADVTKFNASTTELNKKDVENLYKGDLEVIRNAIYARHGYSFKNRRLRFIFDQFVKWYMPVTTDVRNDLTEIEKKNIELIKRYEDHAENYYDDYGR